MILPLAGLLLIVMAICATGPGFYLLRNSRWSTDERICASIGLSLVLTYLMATLVYLLGLPWGACWAWTGICIVALLVSYKQLGRLCRKAHVRRQVAGFAMLIVLGVLLLATIRHFSGGQWFADWLLHYQRAVFFLHRDPGPANLFGGDVIPSRPPLMNLLATFFLAHAGAGFELFQIIFLFLNLLVLFPCVLLAGLLVRFGNRRVWLISAMLALNPIVFQNSTWTWTKLLAAFFLLTCLAFYLRGWKKNDPARMIAATIAMAAAILVHYSAGPYAVALGIHYLLIARRRSRPATEIVGGALAGAALLLTWFGWSLAVYGWNGTFYSNTTVIDSQKLTPAQNAAKVGQNIFATFVPHPLHASAREFELEFQQPSRFGFVRDYFFQIYQTNLAGTWGLIGWTGVGWLMVVQLAGAAHDERRFWLITLAITLFLGIATHGSLDVYGLSHICLQPVTLLGVALLAGGFVRLPRWLANLLALGMAVDAVLAIALQFRMQAHWIPIIATPALPVIDMRSATLNALAIMNSAIQHELNVKLLGDHFVEIAGVIQLIAGAGLVAALLVVSRALHQVNRGFPVFAICMLLIAAGGLVICRFDDAQSNDFVAAATTTSPSPDLETARFQTGIATYQAGQLDQAKDALIDAFLLDPTAVPPRYALKVLLLPHGILLADTDARAAEDFLHHPGDSLVLARFAEVLHHHHFNEPAIDRLEQALQIDPLLPGGLNRLRSLLSEQDRTESEIQKILERLTAVR